MQAETETVTDVAMTIGFELVVFERVGSTVNVTIGGMTSGIDPELIVFETGNRISVTVVGSPGCRDQREYTAAVAVDVANSSRIVVCGEYGSETVRAADLPDELPVVCTPDPTGAALPPTFLHRRGDRYVLMTSADTAHGVHAVA